MSPAGPRAILPGHKPPPRPWWRWWGIKFAWTMGQGRAEGKHHKGVFIDTPFVRLDVGRFPHGRKIRFRRGVVRFRRKRSV